MDIRTQELPFNQGLQYVNQFVRLKTLANMAGVSYILLGCEMNGKCHKGKPFHYGADKVADVNQAVNRIGMLLCAYTVITTNPKTESRSPLAYGENSFAQLRQLFQALWPKGLLCDLCGFSKRWLQAHIQDSTARSYGHFQPEAIDNINEKIHQLGLTLLSLRFTPVK